MKQIFLNTNFRHDSLVLIEQCNIIIEDYMFQNLTLSLRQLYYQLVSTNVIANKESSYSKLSSVVSNARLAGLIDWSAIEDRTRVPSLNPEWKSIAGLVESAIKSFRLERLVGQETYIELWVEKDALSGVLAPIARSYHLPLIVNRGYSSQSAMYQSSKRINRNKKRYGCKNAKILYLGDLDPSGEDMVRDIEDRMFIFDAQVDDVVKIALNINQVEEYNLPPNPTKLTDSRASDFIEKYGNNSWEVDALPPNILSKLIYSEIAKYFNTELYSEIIIQEEIQINELTKMMEYLEDGEE